MFETESPSPIRPPMQKPLQDFFGFDPESTRVEAAEDKYVPIPKPKLKTKLGNREVKPIFETPKPPPLVGLPIPPAPKREVPNLPRERFEERSEVASASTEEMEASSSEEQSLSSRYEEEMPTPPPSKSDMRGSNMSLEDPALMPRFSYRHSVRHSIRLPPPAPSLEEFDKAPRASFRHSRRLTATEASQLNFLPSSSSFLDFNDDDRLSPLQGDETTTAQSEESKGVFGGMSFDDADSFDTFGTLATDRDVNQVAAAPKIDGIRPGSDESEKPLFPNMSFKKGAPAADDDEDGTLDVPRRLTHRPGAAGALKDLQRASITAGKEIASSLRMMGEQEQNSRTRSQKNSVSKVQGDLMVRSRIFRRWNLRYASIVHQKVFGAVLLLFRPEGRGLGGITLRSSKMIALAESSVRKVEGSGRKQAEFMFELKTSQRTYVFACSDAVGRDFWLQNLGRKGS